jgi:hypothetical protein
MWKHIELVSGETVKAAALPRLFAASFCRQLCAVVVSDADNDAGWLSLQTSSTVCDKATGWQPTLPCVSIPRT